jgi:hypothetical protein
MELDAILFAELSIPPTLRFGKVDSQLWYYGMVVRQVDIAPGSMLHFWMPQGAALRKAKDYACQLNSHNPYGLFSSMQVLR